MFLKLFSEQLSVTSNLGSFGLDQGRGLLWKKNPMLSEGFTHKPNVWAPQLLVEVLRVKGMQPSRSQSVDAGWKIPADPMMQTLKTDER